MGMIYFLGTGSAYPSLDRDNSSFLFSSKKRNILVDVSGNPTRRIKEANKSLHEIDTILLTHMHIDHIYGLPSLLWGMWLENRKEPLTIITDDRNESQLIHWLETMRIREWKIQFDIQIHTFNGEKYEEVMLTDELQMFTFPAIHSVPTSGCEFLYDGKRIVYSADSEINSHINAYNHINILIHEATFAREPSKFHSSMDEVLNDYNLDTIDQLIFTHLSDDEPYREVYSQFVEKNNKDLDIQVAYDQMKIIL